MSKITHIKLENVTAFAELDQSFSKGVNVVIGANGTGKTHLLKILYAACAITVGEDQEKGFAQKLLNVFSPYQGRVGRLARRQKKSVPAKITVTRTGKVRLSASFSNHTQKSENVNTVGLKAWRRIELPSAYIPVKEMLAHAPGFLATATRREIAFEEVYTDIVQRALLPRLRGPIDSDRLRLLNALQRAIEGKVVTKGEYFFLKNSQGDLEFSLLAEGVRKIALIWLLIQNGTLLNGSILFWDEPEANLNPSLMGEIVEVILELQRLGVQIFISTHNYVILKEFDLRKKEGDRIIYISLHRDSGGAVAANSSNDYLQIDPNAISGTFNDLYDREIKRSLSGGDSL